MRKSTFYILNLTWGIIMTALGAAAALWLLTVHKLKPTRRGGCWRFTYGTGWGGVSLGLVTIVATDTGERTWNHELGHAVQNAIYGPAQAVLSLASAARYHWRNYQSKHHPDRALPDYDAFWFEGQATAWGEQASKAWTTTDKRS